MSLLDPLPLASLYASDLNPLLVDQLCAPVDRLLADYVRGVYRDGPFDDARFVRCGVLRVLSQSASGRDFLQLQHNVFADTIARSSFFDSLHSTRRAGLLAEVNAQLVRRQASQLDDLLAGFPELKNRPVYAVDGHHLAHAVHSPRDPKGDFVSANSLYLLCLHSGLLVNLGAVQGDGVYRHEMPIFRTKGPCKNKYGK